jgi:hypothetical protein
MFEKVKRLLGFPVNPYKGITVRVEKDNLVEYVPGRHVILSKLPFTFPGSCVNVVYMPGYAIKSGEPGRNLFVLLFTETKPYEFCDDTVRVVLVNQSPDGKLFWVRVWGHTDLLERIGPKGYVFMMRNSRVNWGMMHIG